MKIYWYPLSRRSRRSIPLYTLQYNPQPQKPMNGIFTDNFRKCAGSFLGDGFRVEVEGQSFGLSVEDLKSVLLEGVSIDRRKRVFKVIRDVIWILCGYLNPFVLSNIISYWILWVVRVGQRPCECEPIFRIISCAPEDIPFFCSCWYCSSITVAWQIQLSASPYDFPLSLILLVRIKLPLLVTWRAVIG